ncbi:MAG: cupin domain-containing protein [Oscillospiraceae bacterium]|nr:cupin domain-containing protein [Oscillospiraceae bacterium]
MHVIYKNAFIQANNENITRRTLAHQGNLMMVEVIFHKAGDDYGLHSHPHEQIAYVLKGKFEFAIDGRENVILEVGDSICFDPDVIHGGRPLEDNSILLDVFTPQREDFLQNK